MKTTISNKSYLSLSLAEDYFLYQQGLEKLKNIELCWLSICETDNPWRKKEGKRQNKIQINKSDRE